MSTPIAARFTTPLFGAAFVLAVDSAGAGHLIPALEIATNAPPRGGSWFISIYVLGALLGAPVLARTATRHGCVRVLSSALWVFVFASALVGLSSFYSLTLIGRFLQGFASSPILPLAAAHLGATAAEGSKGRSVSLLSLWYAGGFVAGMAFVSLFLLLSFRIAYLFTATLAAVSAIAMRSVPESPTSNHQGPSLARLVGWFITLTLAAFALSNATLSDSEIQTMPLLYRLAVRGSQVVSLPALVWFAWHDGRARPSLLPADSFRSRRGIASACLSVVAGLAQASVVVMPTCGMAMLGVSAAASGPLLIPVLVGGVGANALAAARLDRWGALPFLATGTVLVAVGNVITASLGTHFVAFEAGALLLGTGVSLLSSGALRHLALSYGSPEDTEARQAALSLLTNVGLLLGGALWGATIGRSSGTDGARNGLLALSWAVAPLSTGLFLLLEPFARGEAGASLSKRSDHA